ncbi:protein phosphatase 2C domain-containing protein [Synechococcus sp. CS-1328]|nr:protein phosphatase 2C domain-containing protein [Synechococcus sp. CS-1328]
MSPWQPARICSRPGAAHQRRGQVCQDWSAAVKLRSLDGLPVQVMAVADGHGGARYHRSDIGSRLACTAALTAVAATLETSRLADSATGQPMEQWRRWLQQDLPQSIITRWRQAVEADRASRPEPDNAAEQENASELESAGADGSLAYGTTLGLVVMTPHWWGHTGLGDWDLARVDAQGVAVLLDEEPNDPASPGEATGSLCLPGAALLFASRSGLHRLETVQARFALLLSTDGLRKSCATDPDFLALTAFLVSAVQAGSTAPAHALDQAAAPADAPEASQEPYDLPSLLDRISREGSGDDVTVAMTWFEPKDAIARAEQATAEPTPAEPATAKPATVQPAASQPATEASDSPEVGSSAVAGMARPSTPRLLPGLSLALAGGLALSSSLGLLGHLSPPRPATPLNTEPTPRESLQPEPLPPEPVRRLVQKLCQGSPAAIRGTLRNRRAQFEGLGRGTIAPDLLNATSTSDPLGALIAASFDPAQRTMVRGSALQALGACAPLQSALQEQWQQTMSSPSPSR